MPELVQDPDELTRLRETVARQEVEIARLTGRVADDTLRRSCGRHCR